MTRIKKQIFLIICLLPCFMLCQQSEDEKKFASCSTIYYQSLCLFNENTTIKMQCPSSDKIKILRTLYGYNPGYSVLKNHRIDSCTFGVKDCTFEQEYSIDNVCTGRNFCIVTIRKSFVIDESAKQLLGCREYNYVQINYQCLPDLPTKDICGIANIRLSHAYIVTPNLLSVVSNKTTCECTLTSNAKNGQILLRRVDMKLSSDRMNQHQCSDAYLEIHENNKGVERKCGYVREAASIFGSGAKKLTLTFVTNDAVRPHDNGFWLEVLASPFSDRHQIDIVCNPKDALIAQKLAEENEKTYKKLKELIDKMKRLNSTSLLDDPKLKNLTQYAKTFLKQNASKLNQSSLELEKIFSSNKSNKTFTNLKQNSKLNKTRANSSSEASNANKELSVDWLDSLEDELDLKEKDMMHSVHQESSTTKRSPQQIAELINDIQNSINQGMANLNLKELNAAGTAMANAQKQATDGQREKSSSTEYFYDEYNYFDEKEDSLSHSIEKRNTIRSDLPDLKDIKWLYFKKNRTAILLTKPMTLSTLNSWNNPTTDMLGSSTFENESKVNQAHISCDRNLTRIAIFYSDKDQLNCFESKEENDYHEKNSFLKCKDNLLERKFINKLKHFYYVHMEPLQIKKWKMNCEKSKRLNTFDRIYLKELNMFIINNNTRNLTSVERAMLNKASAKIKYVYNSPNKTDVLLCSLKTKESSIRKRLVWKLYLITKHESCIPNFSASFSPSPPDLIVINEENGDQLFEETSQESKSTFSVIGSESKPSATKSTTNLNSFATVEKYNTPKQTNTNSSKIHLNEEYVVDENDVSEYTETVYHPPQTELSLISFPLQLFNNKPFVIVFCATNIGIVLAVNIIAFSFLKLRKRNLAKNNNLSHISPVMDNRLLQNYLSLSLSSQNSKNTSPPTSDNKLLTNHQKQSMNSSSLSLIKSETTAQQNSDIQETNSMLLNDYYLNPNEHHLNQHELMMSNLLFKLTERDKEEQKQEQDEKREQKSSDLESVELNESRREILNKFSCDAESKKEDENGGKAFSLVPEINRIPSLNRVFYSVSSVATQANTEQGTFLFERKDYKYRNQREPDMESQIISIEIDLCNNDLSQSSSSKNKNEKTCSTSASTTTKTIKNNNNGNRREIACAKVNDLIAFKNCLNFQLEAARATANLGSQNYISSFSSSSPPSSASNKKLPTKMILRMSARNLKKAQFNTEHESTSQSFIKFDSESNETCTNNLNQTATFKEEEEVVFNLDKTNTDTTKSLISNISSRFKSFMNNASFSSSSSSSSSSQEEEEEEEERKEEKNKVNDFSPSYFFENNFYMQKHQHAADASSSSLKRLQTHNATTNTNTFRESELLSKIKTEKLKAYKDPNKIYTRVVESFTSNEESDDNATSNIITTNSSSFATADCGSKSFMLHSTNSGLSRQEKIKKMLAEEKLILEAAKKVKTRSVKKKANAIKTCHSPNVAIKSNLASIKRKRFSKLTDLFFHKKSHNTNDNNNNNNNFNSKSSKFSHDYVNSGFVFDLIQKFDTKSNNNNNKTHI